GTWLRSRKLLRIAITEPVRPVHRTVPQAAKAGQLLFVRPDKPAVRSTGISAAMNPTPPVPALHLFDCDLQLPRQVRQAPFVQIPLRVAGKRAKVERRCPCRPVMSRRFVKKQMNLLTKKIVRRGKVAQVRRLFAEHASAPRPVLRR